MEWRQALQAEENGAGEAVAPRHQEPSGVSVPSSAAITINEGAVYDAEQRGLMNPAFWTLTHRASDDIKPAEADRYPGATQGARRISIREREIECERSGSSCHEYKSNYHFY